MDLSAIPLVDNHAHPLTRVQPSTPEELRAQFTEAHSPELPCHHVGSAVPYLWALKQIAAVLECEPTEEAILRQRNSMPFEDHARTMLDGANIAYLLLDEGYPPPYEAYSAEQMSDMLAVSTRKILRIETLVADLILQHDRFEDVIHDFDRRVTGLRARGIVALKSIAAYRTGLAIESVDEKQAVQAFGEVRAEAVFGGSLRLMSKTLIDYFLWRALHHAARQGIPVQFHTGYGDPDLDLQLANPLHLRPLFENGDLAAAPIVLLHGSYPYTGESAYLAAAYPNAYMDLAFSLPPLGGPVLRHIVETALAVAPASKIMVSSDGTRIPEHYRLGAIRARATLSSVLDTLMQAGELDAPQAGRIASMLLRDNALRLYGLDP